MVSTDLILSQFEGEQDRHKRYREKVQKYANEEKHLSEDIRHGLVFGIKDFVENIRKQYLPSRRDSAMPQQNQLATTIELDGFLIEAGRHLNCDVKSFVQAGRPTGADKDNRNLLLYIIWRAGHLKNEQIGNLFGINYSSVSHTVKSIKAKLKKNQ